MGNATNASPDCGIHKHVELRIMARVSMEFQCMCSESTFALATALARSFNMGDRITCASDLQG
jgi:hypothetical protein